MLKLFYLTPLLVLVASLELSSPHLLVFANDGTYYQFWPQSRKISWHGTLGSSLLSFQLGKHKAQKQPNSFIVPTIDGHFLYIDSHSQILINRKQVEQLLRVCLDNRANPKNDEQAGQYFVYERFQYYIINLANGQAQDIQTFLRNGIPQNMHALLVLKVSKKYLKQLKPDLTVAWSTISSELNLIPATLFLADPKSAASQQPQRGESALKFRRVGQNEIQMVRGEESFQFGGKGHIFQIFQFISSEKGYWKHPIPYHNPAKLALGFIPNPKPQDTNHAIAFDSPNHQNPGFLHSESLTANNQNEKSNLETCINAFRSFRALTDESHRHSAGVLSEKGFVFMGGNNQNLSNYSVIFAQQQSFKEAMERSYGPTREQPYIWMALILMSIVGSFGLYRMKLKSFVSEMSAKDEYRDKKLEQLQLKLGQMAETIKMYEVYWDKVVYQVAGEHWFEHLVFQGKFLNQAALVYAVRLQGTDVVTLEHQLNTLLNFSHSSLCKLYYYTKNAEFLLIFTQKLQPLSCRALPNHLDVPISSNKKKAAISQLIEAISYLDSKIEISCLPQQALSVQPKIAQDPAESQYAIKINAVPCMLRRDHDDSDQQSRSCSDDLNTRELRENLTSFCHLIIHRGQPLDKEAIDQKLKKEAYSQEEYLQFYDFVLYETREKLQVAQREMDGGSSQSLRDLMFRDMLDHPYLWDSKRKMLFLSDFSNYIETHIDESKVRKLQSHAKDYKVIKTPWIREFHFMFVKEVSNYRKYDYESVRDLIRVIRNKLNHFHEIPKEVRQHVGTTPEGFIEYSLSLFPKLLHFAFVYTRKKKWKLHMK